MTKKRQSRKSITGTVKKKRKALRLKQETQEQREIRLLKQRMWVAAKRSRETLEEREIRLECGREYVKSKRAAALKKKKQRDAKVEVLNYEIKKRFQKLKIKRKQGTPEQRPICLLKHRSKRARERELLREVEKERFKMLKEETRNMLRQEIQSKLSKIINNSKKEQESIENEELFEIVICNTIKEEPREEVEETIDNRFKSFFIITQKYEETREEVEESIDNPPKLII